MNLYEVVVLGVIIILYFISFCFVVCGLSSLTYTRMRKKARRRGRFLSHEGVFLWACSNESPKSSPLSLISTPNDLIQRKAGLQPVLRICLIS